MIIKFLFFCCLCKEQKRPILHSRRTRTRVGDMESQGWINKTHLGFHLWKSCPPLLSYIRRYKEAETLNSGKRRDGKGNRTSICSVFTCYSLHQALLYIILLLIKAPKVSIQQNNDCDGNQWHWLFLSREDWRMGPLTLQVDQGGRVRTAKRRSKAPWDGGWETGMCSWMTMSCLNYLYYFHLLFSSELSV